MKLSNVAIFGVALLGLPLVATHAKELAFLQTDPRFSGGEYNTSNPSSQAFWFYDQYANARYALQQDGVNLDPVSVLTQQAMENHSDAFYIPVPTNRTAPTYPATNTEIAAIKAYVLAGRSVIFNLGSAGSEAMTNDLISRLGLSAQTGSGALNGMTAYPDPMQPVIGGPKGTVGTFNWDTTGYTNSLGNLRSLVNVNGKSVFPYVEKGDLTSKAGAFFFILDEDFLPTYANLSTSQKNLYRNLVEYATTDQYLHYIPATVPEPTALSVLSLGAIALFGRRRRAA